MRRLIILLLITVRAADAQTIAEFRQWYLDKQIINPALLVNAPATNALLSFSPGSYTIRYPSDTYTFNNYQYLASGTYHADKSAHHFGGYIWGQQQATNSLNLNYAYEMPIDRKTNIAFGANLGMYDPLEFKGGKVFRYGLGVAVQNKNKENYIGLSFPHIVTSVQNGDFTMGAYKALILQGGYTFYLPRDIKFIPTAYLQVDAFRKYGPAGPSQLFAGDFAFRYKELVYVNVAVSVRNFNFSTTSLQRFGVGFKPKPEIMIGYQHDALDVTDFRYHSIWLRFSFLPKNRGRASVNTSRPSTSAPAINTARPVTNSPKQPASKTKPVPNKAKPPVKKKP